MKKLLSIIILMLFIWVSFAVNIDKCCIIDTINYKENLKKTLQEISKYPELKDEVNGYVSKVIIAVYNNPIFEYRKVELYKKIVDKTINYVYENNIQRWTPSFLMLSYFAYKMYDLYEYEKNPAKYNLETKLEMLDKYYYTH